MTTGRPQVRQGFGFVATALAAVIGVAFPATRVRAAEAEKEAVRNRSFTPGGHFEVGITYGTTVLNLMTQHQNFNLDIAYNFNDVWALVVAGGYGLGQQTSVASDVFTEVGQKNPTPPPNGPGALAVAQDFQNLWEMGPHAEVNLRWSPIYGKLNLLGELPVHFQTFLTLGGGAGQFQFNSPVFCLQYGTINDPNNPGNTIPGCTEPLHMTDIKVIGNVGGGLRVFIYGGLALKIELRDYLFPDSYFISIQRYQIGGWNSMGNDTSAPNNTTFANVNAYCVSSQNCRAAPSPGITNIVLFNVGLQWIF